MCNQGCRTDDCAHQRESDTWISRDLTPRFLPPVSADEAEDARGPALTRDGFTEALLRRDGPDGGEHGARCTADVTHRDEEHRVSRCALPAGHAPLVHDDGEGCQWTDGLHWRDGGR